MVFKPKFTELKDKIGGFQLLIISAMIILLFYFSVTTRWIPPTKNINATDAFNRTIEIEGIYSYVYKKYVPKEKNFELENLQIPKGAFEFEKAVFLMLLLIILTILYSKKHKGVKPIDETIVREKTKDYLELMKSDLKIKDYNIKFSCFLRKKQIDSGDKLPDTWLQPIEVETYEGEFEYHVLGFNPYSAELEQNLKTPKDFTREDICPVCGFFYDMKVITPEGYSKWYETFELPRRKTT